MKDKFFKVSIVLIFSLAIFLRVKAYLFNLSFWSDESALALNIISRNFISLLKPFDYNQCAPYLFAILSKIFVSCFGISEIVFRFLPFLFGLVSVPVFYILSKKILNKKWSILIANYLFAVNFALIFYCQAFKQYSLEVLITMLLVLCLSRLNLKSLSLKKCFVSGFICFVLFLFSMPTPLILLAFIAYLAYKQKTKSVKQAFFILLPFTLCVLPYYFVYLHPSKMTMMEQAYGIWQNGYIFLNYYSFIKLIKNFFYFVFTPNSFQILTMLLCIFGAIIVYKDREKTGVVILFIIATAVFAALVHIYPLYDRLCLYLIPLIILLATKPLDKLLNFSVKNKWKNYIFSLVVLLLFTFCFKTNLFHHIARLQNPETFHKGISRQIAQLIKKDINSEDIIISSRPTIQDLQYYSKLFKLENKIININSVQTPNVQEYYNILSNLEAGRNYYFYYYDCLGKYNEKTFILAFESWIENNKVKVLYELKDGFDYFIHFEL